MASINIRSKFLGLPVWVIGILAGVLIVYLLSLIYQFVPLKEYTNERYKYSINYPASWKFQREIGKEFAFFDTAQGSVRVEVYPLNTNPIVSSHLALPLGSMKSRDGYNRTGSDNIKIGNLTIDGYDAVQYSGMKRDYAHNLQNILEYYMNYEIIKGDRVYLITFISPTKELEEKNLSTYQAIIDSFRFTGDYQPASVSKADLPAGYQIPNDWKIYKQDTYGYNFIIAYPPDWQQINGTIPAARLVEFYSSYGSGQIYAAPVSLSPEIQKTFNEVFALPQNTTKADATGTNTKVANIKIDGSDGVKSVYNSDTNKKTSYYTFYSLIKDGIYYSISFETTTQYLQNRNQQIYDQMIESLRFF